MVSAHMAALLDELVAHRTAGLDASFARRCCAALGVDGLAVTLSGDGSFGELVWASDGLSARLDDLQFTLGEGPGPDAAGGLGLALDADLRLVPQARWPLFLPAAETLGLGAVFALPLQIGAIQIGVLTCRRSAPGPLGETALADALVFTEALALALLGDRGEGEDGWLEEGVWLHRAEVHQATGMISVQLGIAPAIALLRLRAFAFAEERPVLEVARDVVARRLRFPNPGEQQSEGYEAGDRGGSDDDRGAGR